MFFNTHLTKMRTRFFVLFLFIGYCFCTKNYNDGGKTGVRRMRNDKDNSIVYPCSVNDIKCIRKFFSRHGRCKRPSAPVPETIKYNRLSFHMATSNVSSTIVNGNVTGLDGNVTSFFINKKTNKLVIAFEAKPLIVSTSEMIFTYHPVGEEPIQLTDYFKITYTSVIFTATIPNIKDLQPNKADYYSFLGDGDPKYVFGPGLSRSSNPVVRKAYCDLISKIQQNAKEALVIQARNFMNYFLQHKICRFRFKTEKYD